MRKAGQLAAKCLDYITSFVKEGISTGELDDLCREFIIKNGAICACLGYRGYPKTTCISINHVICHGIPDYERKLVNGDIVNIDVTVILNGWYGDTSRMYYVGNPKIKATRLCEVTYECLMRGIDAVKPGAHFGDIGAVIEDYAHKYGYSVVDMFCGHGLGRVFHDEPNVMHCGKKGTGPLIEEGMFFTIEPMINVGKKDGIILSNGWTAVTRDKSLSAQFEHSLGVTKDGCEVFTYSPKGLDKPPYKLG
ncbi:MAG: type I methionyl aminopeptidase [Alphaproteobacteria bacterium]|nr:type I methionyl aminopeptidase [Alphaproteobacteria bacterium]